MLDKAIRELDRERMGLQTQEKKLITEIKAMAKKGQMVRATSPTPCAVKAQTPWIQPAEAAGLSDQGCGPEGARLNVGAPGSSVDGTRLACSALRPPAGQPNLCRDWWSPGCGKLWASKRGAEPQCLGSADRRLLPSFRAGQALTTCGAACRMQSR